MSSTDTAAHSSQIPDRWTLIALSALAYVVAVALHEHAGHAAACHWLGSRATELGAFYVNCDDSRLSLLAVRWVAIAGPAVSLLTGVICFAALRLLPTRAAAAIYFTWLLGSIGWMEAAGYLFFSGVTGIGDLGTAADGALAGLSAPWLWRAVLTIAGVVGYVAVVRLSLRALEPSVAGSGLARWAVPRAAARVSYLTGAVVYLIIGAFNPYGWQIVLISVLPASMGGTSGLLWMFRRADASRNATGPGLYFGRDWGWIVVSVVLTLTYGAVFARTLR